MTDGATRERNKFDDIFSRFDTIHECDGQTERRTPAATAVGHAYHIIDNNIDH